MAIRKNSKEYKEFSEILNNVPPDKKQIGERLIEELLFMRKTLENLKRVIERDGPVELFEQGKQKFTRENPAMKSYNTTVNRYSQLYKQLTELMPKTADVQRNEALSDFIKGE